MEKWNTKRSLPTAGYESPRVCTCEINVRKMMCSSLSGGTEDMDPTDISNGVENMGIDTIDF